ncbi:MAG: deoxyhypusine synthase [Deltaproteobacteria bacterium]|nr:MAG: deoxyhypusine synthase [Deltaproteobacteria bacterium]
MANGFPPISPPRMGRRTGVRRLVENYFTAYNAARLNEACRLLAERVMRPGVRVGVSLAGAISPTGLARAVLVPMMKAGFIDYMVSTGANLFHDLHYSLGYRLLRGRPDLDDVDLRKRGLVRIYDILVDFDTLLGTDAFCRDSMHDRTPSPIGTAELHHRLGRLARESERRLGLRDQGLLSAAYTCKVPIYTSSPGDSAIGMNLAALRLEGRGPVIDPSIDVNETAAIVFDATRGRGKSAVLILGGGSPKNFLLQTEPQIQEVLGLGDAGHDFFVQITDARPDTGGLSGATPSEAVSWGKIDPAALPDTVVCYTDISIALPIVGAYLLECAPRRPLARLYEHRVELVEKLRRHAVKARRQMPRKGPSHRT